MKKPYQLIGLGGTFDHFHAGHKHFLNFAGQLGQKLQIGITCQKLTLSKPYSHTIESYQLRQKNVGKYCLDHQFNFSIMKLTNIYGPTLDDKCKIQALAVTQETLSGAIKINQARQATGLKELPVHVCSMLRDSRGQILHSASIRSGMINRQGQAYLSVLDKDLTLNTKQRDFFSKPQGKIVDKPSNANNHLIWLIGDGTLEKFITHRWFYNLGVYDKINQRLSHNSKLIASIKPDDKIGNKAGTISKKMVTSLVRLIKNQDLTTTKHLLVNGEEDLAAVALFLLAPLGTKIYYGQPNSGLIEVEITEKFKDKTYRQFLD
jgi:pantetheine-phosphate adenylyltransferase